MVQSDLCTCTGTPTAPDYGTNVFLAMRRGKARIVKAEPKGGPKPLCRPFFREGFKITFSPFGKFRTGRAIFFRPTPNFFANRFTEVGCGGEVGRAAAFGEDGCQERCRAAETTRTPRASTYSASTIFGRNPAPLLPFKCSATLFREVCSGKELLCKNSIDNRLT